MISVVGLSPERAEALLSAEGISVSFEEARSKKGVQGGTEARVIRQQMTDDKHATLVFSVFRTEPDDSDSK
ncbi:MAG TPA: hypothetical protein VN538_11400 [Clostridia bacterium]|nr:hypothetical protein [Clostridia bacterium]